MACEYPSLPVARASRPCATHYSALPASCAPACLRVPRLARKPCPRTFVGLIQPGQPARARLHRCLSVPHLWLSFHPWPLFFVVLRGPSWFSLSPFLKSWPGHHFPPHTPGSARAQSGSARAPGAPKVVGQALPPPPSPGAAPLCRFVASSLLASRSIALPQDPASPLPHATIFFCRR